MTEPEQTSHGDGHGAFHLPPPSIWPPVLALGIALILTGLVLNLFALIVGAVLAVTAVTMWVRDARKEFEELPE
jgi:Cytochrome c oxidase subunit IV